MIAVTKVKDKATVEATVEVAMADVVIATEVVVAVTVPGGPPGVTAMYLATALMTTASRPKPLRTVC